MGLLCRSGHRYVNILFHVSIWADISFCTTAVAIWSFYIGLWTFDILLHPPWQAVCQENIALRETLATLVDDHEDHEALWKWTGGRCFLHSHTAQYHHKHILTCTHSHTHPHTRAHIHTHIDSLTQNMCSSSTCSQRNCFCDSECAVYGDCCIDAIAFDPAEQRDHFGRFAFLLVSVW